ncbi:MAG TPA: ArdC-like ssDNA-binding domain-containing protein [Acidisarcina sp.]
MEYQGNSSSTSFTASNGPAPTAIPDSAPDRSNRERNKTQELVKENVDFLIQQLEAGHSETLTAYLTAMGRFHAYSFGNILLIARQKPDAERVAGMYAWNQLGRRVVRGQKGIGILAPMIGASRKKEQEQGDAENANRPVLLGFRKVYVWDVAQTEGAPLPSVAEVTGEVGSHLDHLRTFISSIGVELEYSEKIAPALGMSYGGKIALLPGQTKAEEFSALVHETAHEMLHKAERRTATTKVVRETEAEAIAFIVSKAIGLTPGTSSADYIHLYHGNASLLTESLAVIQQTSAVILDVLKAEESFSQEVPETRVATPEAKQGHRPLGRSRKSQTQTAAA